MKKMLFILPNLGGGGAERVILKLAEFLNSTNKVKADILIFKNIVDYDTSLFSSGRIIPVFPKDKKIKRNLFSFIFQMFKISKNYDMLIGGLELFPSYLSILIGKFQGKKVIITNHIFLSKYIEEVCPRSKALLHKTLTMVINRFADCIVSVSAVATDDLKKNFFLPKSKLTYIYNPIDFAEINKLAQEPIENKYKHIFLKKTIISIGRLDVQKGFDLLIKAAALIKNLDFNVVILGKGKDEKELKLLAKKLAIDDKIYFLGFQKNPFKFLKHSRCYVMSSRSEGFGIVLVEAMALGRPVISVDCSAGPREILENGEYGILVPAGDIKGLANVIKESLENDELIEYFSKKAIQRAKEFDIKLIGEKWLNLLSQI